jgi:hypothetical protein
MPVGAARPIRLAHPPVAQTMPETTESEPGLFDIFRRDDPGPSLAWSEIQKKKELEASLALLRERRREEHRIRRAKWLISFWPIAIGLALGAVAPELRTIAAMFGYWGTVLVFPYVVLAARPEIQVGPITHMLPAIMLYAQFPIEGWLARYILRRRVKLSSVTAQVLLFHFLGIAELWLLSGALGKLLAH